MTAQVRGLDARRDRLERTLVDRPRRASNALPWRSAARRRSAPQARIIASGFARSCPRSAGAVPCGASAIATVTSWSGSKASNTDSAPAIEPNIGSTRSERQSPSRFSAGITSGASAAPDSSPAEPLPPPPALARGGRRGRGGGRRGWHQLLAPLAQRRDHDAQMLVEVNPELRRAFDQVFPAHGGREARRLHLLLD